MSVAVSKEEAKKWIGRNIDAVKKDGTVVTGKLVGIKGSRLIFAAQKGKVHTKAIIPLVLFDLLAVGTAGAYGGYGYGGYGGGFGGYPGGYGYGAPGYGAPGYGAPGYGYGYGQPFF
ncbi:hypothetical protein EHS13_28430 [Paenibacillus psychroresistens]|uniref:50S ribosomal protein L33 n=1 Tax=Paenibacillus psychroresistens TaxID=1778678 RepID=A0A6B8RRN6_9BACL|nr:hypothetical protein [Paenibacillus psychroresistens]QGQ98527.1 hypothetical protein EHS13_28430 [Paenibacillus psychroresistens]